MDAVDQGQQGGVHQGEESEEGSRSSSTKEVAFFLFQKKMRKGVLAMNGKALAEMWNNMEEKGKKIYREEEVEGKKKYLEEMEKYKKGKEEGGDGDL